MKAVCLSLVMLAAVGLCGGEVLIDAGKAEAFSAIPALKTDDEGNLIPAVGKTYITTQSIAVDGKKQYRISFEYKGGADNSGTAKAAVVAIPYDAKGRRIQGGNVDHIVGSETTLAEDVPAGSDELILNANPAWSAAIGRKAIYAVGFGARKDYKDLPNFMVMGIKSQRVDENGRIVVKLSRKTRSDCKAGLAVRLHRYGWNGVGKEHRRVAADELHHSGVEQPGGRGQVVARLQDRETRGLRRPSQRRQRDTDPQSAAGRTLSVAAFSAQRGGQRGCCGKRHPATAFLVPG